MSGGRTETKKRGPATFFSKSLLLFVFLSSFFIASVHSAVLGIDYGAEFLKISIVAPGRSPITLVINEISKRKTTIAVSFVNEDRWLGEEAMNYQARYPEKVTTRLRELLGKDASSDLVLDYKEKYKLPFEIRESENRSTVEVLIDNNNDGDAKSHTIEELVATTLQYAMKIGTALGKGPIKDAVVSVPPYFSQTQRRALYDAADIAGLNVMALVSDVSCAALQWGIDKDFAKNETRNVIFYDVGSSHSSASLVEFGALSERRSKKTYGSFVVKSVEWNDNFGGEDLDVLLVNHFLEEFQEKHGSETNGKDVTKDKRAVAKLRKQVRKTKEMLSANKEAPVSVEGMFEDIDFRSTIDRATFEAKAEKTFQRMLEPLRRLVKVELPKLGLTLEDVEAIEVIGGTVRTPALQRMIDEEVLKDSGKSIDKRLDADEAVAMGAGLFAANMSTTFRMRKFGAADALPYGIDYQVVGNDDDEEGGNNKMTLFNRFDAYPSRSKVTIENVTANEYILKTFIAAIQTGDESEDNVKEELVLPPAWSSADVATFNVSGIDHFREKYNNTEAGNVTVTFAMDPSGIFFVEKAQFEVIVTDMVEIPRPKKTKKADDKKSKKNITIEETNATKAEESTTAEEEKEEKEEEKKEADAETPPEVKEEEKKEGEEEKETEDATEEKESSTGEKEEKEEAKEGEKEEEKKEEKEEVEEDEEKEEEEIYIPQYRERKRKFKHDLLVSESDNPIVQMTSAEILSSTEKLEKLHAKDQAKRETEAAKSNLEAYIYSSRSKVRQDEEIEKVTTEEQREAHLQSLEDAEDWLYTDEGENANKTTYETKHKGLKDVSDAFIFRAQESSVRPESVKYAKKWIADTRKAIGTWKDKKKHIFANETEPLLQDIADLESFLEEKEKEQEAKEAHEDPAFTSKEVKSELSKRMTKYKRLKSKPAPKVEKPKTNSTGNATGKNSTKKNSKKDKKGEEDTTEGADEGVENTSAEEEGERGEGETATADGENVDAADEGNSEGSTADPPMPDEPEPTKKKSWFGKVFDKKEPEEAAEGDL